MEELHSKIFSWLGLGILITFLTGYYVSFNDAALGLIFSGNFFILIIIEFGLAIFLLARIRKMSATTARITYLLYSGITGLTFASIFITYELQSIIYIFLITSVLLFLMAMIAKSTKIDFTKFSSIFFIILLSIIVGGVINIFFLDGILSLGLSIVTVVLFLGFIIYDLQKIEHIRGSMSEDNLAIYGAFNLYLDFINIFLSLLRLFGNRK